MMPMRVPTRFNTSSACDISSFVCTAVTMVRTRALPDRENLAYSARRFQREADKDAALVSVLGRHEEAAIVYCSTRRAVEELTALCEERFPERVVCGYHAGMEQGARDRSQKLFVAGGNTIIVATNAFGMGINRPDIRLVVHYNLPGSIEAYYQEAGRAGRDGKAAECVLYFSQRDLRTQRFFIDKLGENNPQLGRREVELLQRGARRKLDAMLQLAESERCRRAHILDYFGQQKTIRDCACDVCRSARTGRVASNTAGESSHSRTELESRNGARRGYMPVYVRKSAQIEASRAGKSPHRAERSRYAETSGHKPLPGELDERARSRFERLRLARYELAKEHGWPAFCILHDTVLRELARLAPTTLSELEQIKGIGPKKIEQYGKAFLQAIIGSKSNAAVAND